MGHWLAGAAGTERGDRGVLLPAAGGRDVSGAGGRAATPGRSKFAAWLGGLACTVATLVLFAQPQWLWDVVLRAAG